MKLYGILILEQEKSKPRILAKAVDTSSFGFFKRNSVKEYADFVAITTTERTAPGSRRKLSENEFLIYCYADEDELLTGVIITDQEYQMRAGFSLLSKVLSEFKRMYGTQLKRGVRDPEQLSYPELEDYLRNYQDPKNKDTLTKIAIELDETKVIISDTLNSLLERGKKLDVLVDRAESLSQQSKVFYKTARKTNQCCAMF